jgi:hypothetical protein
MRQILDAAWMFAGFLKFGGLAVALGGVAMFGRHFIRSNARGAHNDSAGADGDAPIAWGGAGAKRGLKVLALGLALQLAAFVLALLLPGRS